MDLAVREMKASNYNTYFKKAGQEVVDKNDRAIDAGLTGMVKVDIPAAWAAAEDEPDKEPAGTPFVKEIVIPMDRQQGDKLPISILKKHGCLDGTWETVPLLIPSAAWLPRFPSGIPMPVFSATAVPPLAPHAADPPHPADGRRKGRRTGKLCHCARQGSWKGCSRLFLPHAGLSL